MWTEFLARVTKKLSKLSYQSPGWEDWSAIKRELWQPVTSSIISNQKKLSNQSLEVSMVWPFSLHFSNVCQLWAKFDWKLLCELFCYFCVTLTNHFVSTGFCFNLFRCSSVELCCFRQEYDSKKRYLHLYILSTYIPHKLHPGVAEVSQIFLQNASNLPKWLIYEEYCRLEFTSLYTLLTIHHTRLIPKE
jgi:hypothetical protein